MYWIHEYATQHHHEKWRKWERNDERREKRTANFARFVSFERAVSQWVMWGIIIIVYPSYFSLCDSLSPPPLFSSQTCYLALHLRSCLCLSFALFPALSLVQPSVSSLTRPTDRPTARRSPPPSLHANKKLSWLHITHSMPNATVERAYTDDYVLQMLCA